MIVVSMKCLHCGSNKCTSINVKPLKDGNLGQELHYKCVECGKSTYIEARAIKVGDEDVK